MCSRELCKQFVKAHDGAGICLFEGPSSGSHNGDTVSYANKQTNYSVSNVQY